MDNATNNNTMVAALHGELPFITAGQRLRWAGFLIKLVVKAILFGSGLTAFSRDIVSRSDSEAFTLWRKFGAIGKIHNNVKST